MIHGDLKGQNVHIAYSFEYATAAARDAATGMAVNDEGKFCRVLADNTIWMLAASSPLTWVGIASGTNTGAIATASSGTTFPPTPLNYEFFYRTDLDNVFIWNPIVSAWIDVTAAVTGGDMLKLSYDPTNVNADVFAMDNMAQGTFNLFISAAEKAKIAAAEVVSNKGAIGGYAALNSNREVMQLPAGASTAAVGAVLRQDGQWVAVNAGGTGSVGIPVYTQAQIDVLVPTDGLTVYNSTKGELQVYVGNKGKWEKIKFNLGASIGNNTFIATASMVLNTNIHQFIEVVANTTPVNITLPDPSTNIGFTFTIKATDLAFAATIDVVNNGLIDIYGIYTFMNIGEAVTLISDGLEWEVISSYNDVQQVSMSNIKQEIADNTYNIAMNSFRITAIDSLSRMNLVDGIIDQYVDVTGLTNTSTYNYNSGNTSLSNFSADAVVVDPGSFETTRPTSNVSGSVSLTTLKGNSFKVGAGAISAISIPARQGGFLDPAGTGTLEFILIKLPAGQYIENLSDKPTHAYIKNPVNQLAKVILTEAQLSTMLPSTLNQSDPTTWWKINFPTPVTVPDGEYAWVIAADTLTPIANITSIIVSYFQNQPFEFGHMLQIFPSGTTFNTTFTILSIVEMNSSIVDVSVFSEYPKENLNLVGLRAISAFYDDTIGGTFRVSSFCEVTSIKLPLYMNTQFGIISTVGAGDMKIGIRPLEFGKLSSSASYGRIYATDTLSHYIPDMATITMTRTQLVTALPTYVNDAAAIADILANGYGFTATFASPISLPPGEYGWYIDKRTNPIIENLSLIASNNPKDATMSALLRMNTGGTAKKLEHPLFDIVGKYKGAAAAMVAESISQTALVAPTTIYYSGIFDSAINSSTSLRISTSRDGGVTWTVVTTSEIINSSMVGTKMVYGSADVSAQPVGTNIKYKVETLAGSTAILMASSLQWR